MTTESVTEIAARVDRQGVAPEIKHLWSAVNAMASVIAAMKKEIDELKEAKR